MVQVRNNILIHKILQGMKVDLCCYHWPKIHLCVHIHTKLPECQENYLHAQYLAWWNVQWSAQKLSEHTLNNFKTRNKSNYYYYYYIIIIIPESWDLSFSWWWRSTLYSLLGYNTMWHIGVVTTVSEERTASFFPRGWYPPTCLHNIITQTTIQINIICSQHYETSINDKLNTT